MDSKKMSREGFVEALERLLWYANLDVKALRYISAADSAIDEESVEIIFESGATKRACIEADSCAAIIKDVLRRCV